MRAGHAPGISANDKVVDIVQVRRFRQAGACSGVLDLRKQRLDLLGHRVVSRFALLDGEEIGSVGAR